MSKKDNNPRDDTKIKFEKLLDLMLSWSKENKYKPMQLKEAVTELWMTEQNFFYYINRVYKLFNIQSKKNHLF